MNIILFDDDSRGELLPLTYTRPIADLRIGILTIREKWDKYLKESSSSLTQKYLSEKFKMQLSNDNLLVNGSILPNQNLVSEIQSLDINEKLVEGNVTIAARVDSNNMDGISLELISRLNVIKKSCNCKFEKLNHIWDIFQKNGTEIEADFKLITAGRSSMEISKTNQILGDKEYGNKELILKGNGLYLNASRLEFIHPFTKENIYITKEIPKKFRKIFPNQ